MLIGLENLLDELQDYVTPKNQAKLLSNIDLVEHIEEQFIQKKDSNFSILLSKNKYSTNLEDMSFCQPQVNENSGDDQDNIPIMCQSPQLYKRGDSDFVMLGSPIHYQKKYYSAMNQLLKVEKIPYMSNINLSSKRSTDTSYAKQDEDLDMESDIIVSESVSLGDSIL
ncbi:UNKNOWN [Stylonychia lemnae]|uniref:Uncharacterized protein n=1 Tax=Stylonychia lemnae TaxID=5949 RepID=A0A078B722_STYLE|nr:UNKNOWN [Stylonychia lemnae]|eukprot:CDW89102.1 UNKNOWN [Stylonychia lemnae]